MTKLYQLIAQTCIEGNEKKFNNILRLLCNVNVTNVNTTTDGSGVGMTVDYSTFASVGQSSVNNVIINNPGTGYIDGDIIYINDPLIPAPSIGTDYASFIYRTNLTTNLSGWQSYKIVVKQQEQDYYNVYLPGIVNGAINKDGVESATEATILERKENKLLFSDLE